LKAQTPAEGILIHKDYGDAKQYIITCECCDEGHSHHIWVEAEDVGVTVTTYVDVKTDYWSEKVEQRYDIDNEIYQNIHWYFVGLFNDWHRRFKLIWQILTKGYIQYQASLIMSQQQALNYAETLKKAVTDVEKFRASKDPKNKEAVKAAQEGDCV